MLRSRTGNDPRRKILIVVPKLVIGGAELQIVDICPKLNQSQFVAQVFTTKGPGPLDAVSRQAGLPVITTPVLFKGRANALIAEVYLMYYLVRHRPDIVHFHLPEAYLIGGLAAVLTGCKNGVMSRLCQNLYQQDWKFVRRMESWLHRRMRAVIGNSCAVVSELAEEGVPPERLGLIRCGIDASSFLQCDRAAERRQLDIGPDTLVLAILATLWPYKGHADLLEALGRCHKDLPQDWLLLVVGRDEGMGRILRAQADTLGIAQRIRWLGERSSVRGILAATDISVLASHQESFPVSILESMAAGLPLIVTNVGGCSEAVEEGVTGRVVPPHDPEAMARAILELAGSSETRARMGAAGRARVSSHFSIESCVGAHERLYHAVLANDGRRLEDLLAESVPRSDVDQ